ncbi:amyloid beta A4 precursor protein-binding family B member 1-interacting protein isoform X2 [Neocloeon triangulifer]|uniref:amyloid beta A4 precursor protein-binding family B member 1-interacting protein isoform X2 n=1 Tax=Neocloeon triangulifer TaxID=2078957 RepID=UPI00286F4C48|nr:amyloid beta A4 precursor protein-binding family B member 1-interacting protein isoform X2 [Neocloeon triangulifer]XP_059469182.1 amyloid beta A4 precursor protein-binding family B member 1-interacting protein isoform X2 [Neocloeon triangulifer]XP_059469183.1 amyloid beta A4 precursor protein-binding family B member 1-interacting protein isoform X2 [Neocloeon triangulifer]
MAGVSPSEDPERLLDEWLGQLDNLAEGLDNVPTTVVPRRRTATPEISAPRIDSFRFSMANLEDSQDLDLDAILGELSALETECQAAINRQSVDLSTVKKKVLTPAPEMTKTDLGHRRTPSFSSSEGCNQQRVSFLSETESEIRSSSNGTRTDSPDNDSAFSDNVSMLSGESTASSGGSGGRTDASSKSSGLGFGFSQMDEASREKAEKIRIALEKMREANVKKLFVKAFSADESTKSLLVDEKMTCGHVTRLLADKNHVTMGPKWAIVEHLPELHMERIYEDHELLVDNLMLWARDSKNKLLFLNRPDKYSFFTRPEPLLVPNNPEPLDEKSRDDLLDEFFNGSCVAPMEGPLYLKEKRGWRKLHFVLRASGLYFVKGRRDLVCLAPLDSNEAYRGLGWRKRLKAPTDYCFALKHPRLQKGLKYVHLLCAESQESLDRWMMAIRLAKHGRVLMDNFAASQADPEPNFEIPRIPVEAQMTFQRRSGSLSSQTSSPLGSQPNSPRKQVRHSGSQDEPFEADPPPINTIKRKPPSLKPQLPLTPTTRQLAEVASPPPLVSLPPEPLPPPPPVEEESEEDDFPPPPPPLAPSELAASVLSLDVPPPPPPPKPNSSRRITFAPPPPPKRSVSTRLSSAPVSAESAAFLSDLQRVVRRNWQVAEKCKRDGNTTPHEVLGFRDPPDYRETNVTNWLAEHYGTLYENVPARQSGKRPPPPPVRSETTQLSQRKPDF